MKHQIKNRDDKIRTCGPRDPNTVRYQTALHPDRLLNFLDLERTYGATSPRTILNRSRRQSQTALHPDNLLLATALIVNTLSNTLYQLMHDNFTLNKNINQAFNFWCIISMQ